MERFGGIPLKKLNTITKYPSIPTYHKRGDRGKLTENLNVNFSNEAGVVDISEKIDGTNGRIVIYKSSSPKIKPDFLIGSREELLYAKGDYVKNPSLGIVEVLLPIANRILDAPITQEPAGGEDLICTFYLEVYGKGIGAQGDQYSSSTQLSSLFDIAVIDDVQNRTREDIAILASKRDTPPLGFGLWSTREEVYRTIKLMPVVPCIFSEYKVEELPTSISDTYDWMRDILKTSRAKITNDGKGIPEGIIIRESSSGLDAAAKLKFKDYERVLNGA